MMRWVIGDIHGMLRPLDALLNAVDRRDSQAKFIFVGDYINRGPDAQGVISRLLELDDTVFLRGNHDDVIDLIVNGLCYICHQDSPDALSAFSWFMNHGLGQTWVSYGADQAELEQLTRNPDPIKLKHVASGMPDKHREFFRALKPLAEFDDFFVAHAFWDPDESDSRPDLASQLAKDPKLRNQVLWGRFTLTQILQKKRWKRRGFFGHTPVSNYRDAGPLTPVFGPQIILIDTAAALGPEGRLTAFCADDGEVIQVDRAGTLVHRR